MPDQDPNTPVVKVSFDPNREPQFKFVDDTVRMTGAGIVVLTPGPGPRRWKFQAASVKNDTLNQFKEMVLGDGNIIVIEDLFYDESPTPYSYNVTVRLGGKVYVSPDPVIVNDPPAIGP